ncbi:MAG: 5'/3'-nucleotidase SurE [Chloroflexi bacterium]|nr:5'/3'-nucleotidase SurE [Chloroflexota bacterium]
MKILVTNDDGISAPGLWALVAELTEVGEVVVFAPDREQSGTGTAITLHGPVRVGAADVPIKGVKAYAVEGTPADSVILGLALVNGVGLVVSGVNRGANMGDDVLLSGTVGAALQGYLHGLPSIALSVVRSDDARFDVAARLGKLLAQRIVCGVTAEAMLLNVNLPNLGLDRIGGIEITRVGKGGYSSAISMGHDGEKDSYRIAMGKPQWVAQEGTDVQVVERGSISLTPLRGILNVADEIPFLNGSLSSLLQELKV